MRALRVWVPVLLWAGLIFGLSSVPSLGTGLGTWDTILRKAAHMAEYAMLVLLLARATRRPWLALAIGIAYAASDEVHQTFVRGRHGSPADAAIDTAGMLLALAGLHVVRRRAAA